MPDAPPLAPTPNKAREVIDTQLQVDVAAMTAHATITLAAGDAGASLEVGDLMIDSVTAAGVAVPFAIASKQMDLGLAASSEQVALDVAYHFKTHEQFDGDSMTGFTFLWPYFCGNLFPCHSAPSDGTTFALALDGVPAGKTAVFPASIPNEAPSYQIAWSIGAYTELPLGTTSAGTKVSVWYLPTEQTAAMAGTASMIESMGRPVIASPPR